jgi:hypothetical protein
MATYTIAARYLAPQPFYKDGKEVLPNPSRTYRVRNTYAMESRVTCVEHPDQAIDWTLYNHGNKVYCKRSDALFWHICDTAQVAPDRAPVPPVIPVKPVVCGASRKKRYLHRVKVNLGNVLKFLKS